MDKTIEPSEQLSAIVTVLVYPRSIAIFDSESSHFESSRLSAKDYYASRKRNDLPDLYIKNPDGDAFRRMRQTTTTSWNHLDISSAPRDRRPPSQENRLKVVELLATRSVVHHLYRPIGIIPNVVVLLNR